MMILNRILRIISFAVGICGSPLWLIIWLFTGKRLLNYFMNFAVFGDWEDDD